MKIKLIHLITLAKWLRNLPLDKKSTRERTRFLKLVREILEESEHEEKRIEILKKYAEKDKDGEYVMVEDEYGRKNYDLSEENEKKVREEYDKVLEQEVEISLDGNKSKLESIKEILSTTNYEFQGQMADEYNTWCEVFDVE